MTVKELIKELQEVENQDRVVLMSADSEGNSYKMLRHMDDSAARRDGYSYELGLEELTDDLRDQGYEEEDVMAEDNSFAAFVLWP